MSVGYQHTAVLINEAVAGLKIEQEGVYLDATFGRGGHSRHILAQLGDKGRLLAIDRDPAAVAAAQEIQDHRFSIVHGSFSRLAEYVEQQGLSGRIAGILLDLGVSSPQLDDPERGFSFMQDGPLDMRMNPEQGESAAEWLQHADEQEIAWVLKTFGEERFARRIARAIVLNRSDQPQSEQYQLEQQQRVAKQRGVGLTRTRQLAELIASAIPVRDRHKHPATRTFQAIRIYINRELEEIEGALTGAIEVLAPKGRLAVITFHSLEDRIVKRFIRQHSQGAAILPRLPLTEVQRQQLQGEAALKALGKVMPGQAELAANPRARSAVLRLAEKASVEEGLSGEGHLQKRS